MKSCPKCRKVFEDERRFCIHDGATLVAEEFAPPSGFGDDEPEAETVIRSAPPVQIPITPARQPSINAYSRTDPTNPAATQQSAKSGCFKYSLILVLGLFIGGGIVLAGLGAGYWYLSEKARVTRTDSDLPDTSPKEPSIKKPRTDQHDEKSEDAGEKDLNGLVITRRAVLRVLPSKSAKVVDTLPRGDRLTIIRRRSSKSPWYEVKCEHETLGWVHGNDIKYVTR